MSNTMSNTVSNTASNNANELNQFEQEEKRQQQVCMTLMDSFGKDLMNMAIKYKNEYGVGVLNINLMKYK